jgi:hypothetical protein
MTQTKLDFSYKSFINFTNREEYLKFRQEWKKDYLAKIEEIRKLKRDLKQDQRENPDDSHRYIYRALITARHDISEMLADKWGAASEANRQYLEQKEFMTEDQAVARIRSMILAREQAKGVVNE